jgi:hypothetical protein
MHRKLCLYGRFYRMFPHFLHLALADFSKIINDDLGPVSAILMVCETSVKLMWKKVHGGRCERWSSQKVVKKSERLERGGPC